MTEALTQRIFQFAALRLGSPGGFDDGRTALASG
jgi:hypothetical protein